MDDKPISQRRLSAAFEEFEHRIAAVPERVPHRFELPADVPDDLAAIINAAMDLAWYRTLDQTDKPTWDLTITTAHELEHRAARLPERELDRKFDDLKVALAAKRRHGA